MSSNGRNSHCQYVLGIDMGTTTVKVALVDRETQRVHRSKSRETQAGAHSDVGADGNEQDPAKMLTALQFCLSGLPKEDLIRVVKIGVSGQMHGLMLWKQGNGWVRNTFGRFDVNETSPLYTWQDQRCSVDFISKLPKPMSHLKLASGLGCVTLFWLHKHCGDTLKQYNCAATIQDFVVSMLCGLDSPVMSVHNAASWGYFDTVDSSWNLEILSEAGFPVHLLPTVQAAGSIAGHTQTAWYGIPQNTPVATALGDLQCSIFSRLKHQDDAVLNISTSAQLAFQMHENFVPPQLDSSSCIEYFPFFDKRYLAVAASLTGGNVMAGFVRMLQQWTHEFGLGVPEAKIWEKLHSLGEEDLETDLEILPTIYGERHCPNQRGCVSNITSSNNSLGSVFCALCRGVITNLHTMMSQDFLLAAGVKRIVGSGTAVVKNSILRQEIQRQYKLPLALSPDSDADAAVGAATALL